MNAHPSLPDGFTLPEAPIAVGATADVYACMQGWVLKLFHENRDASYVDAESRAAQAAFELTRDVPAFKVPAVGGKVSVDGRFGLLYARVEGDTLQAELFKAPTNPTGWFAECLATLQSQMHAIDVPQQRTETNLPRQTDRLRYAIQHAKGITEHRRIVTLQALERQAPVSPSLCHGDFHLGNIFVGADNQTHIIDWNDASLGDALADVARTSLLIRFGESSTATQPEPPPGLSALEFESLRQKFNQTYLETYFGLNPRQDWQARLNAWLQIVATARLNENISPFERKQLEDFIAA